MKVKKTPVQEFLTNKRERVVKTERELFEISYLRHEGWSLKEVMKHLGISRTTLYRRRKEIESRKPPTLEKLVEMYPEYAWGQVKWLMKKNMTDAQRHDYMEFEMQNYHQDMLQHNKPRWRHVAEMQH